MSKGKLEELISEISKNSLRIKEITKDGYYYEDMNKNIVRHNHDKYTRKIFRVGEESLNENNETLIRLLLIGEFWNMEIKKEDSEEIIYRRLLNKKDKNKMRDTAKRLYELDRLVLIDMLDRLFVKIKYPDCLNRFDQYIFDYNVKELISRIKETAKEVQEVAFDILEDNRSRGFENSNFNISDDFDYDWNSLLYIDNRDFPEISLVDNMLKLVIEVNGEVEILDKKTGDKYTNNSYIPKELKKAIKDRNIYDSDRYEIIESNWFTQTISLKNKYNEYKYFDDYVFESEPKDKEELILDLLTLKNWCYEFLI